MDAPAKILVAGGMLNLLYGFFTGFILGGVRTRLPEAPKYLMLAHRALGGLSALLGTAGLTILTVGVLRAL